MSYFPLTDGWECNIACAIRAWRLIARAGREVDVSLAWHSDFGAAAGSRLCPCLNVARGADCTVFGRPALGRPVKAKGIMKSRPFATSCVTLVWKMLLLLLLPSLLLLLTTQTISIMLGQLTQPRSRRFRRRAQRQDKVGLAFSFRGSPSQAVGPHAYRSLHSATTTEASAHCSEEECLDHVVIAPLSWLLCNVT